MSNRDERSVVQTSTYTEARGNTIINWPGTATLEFEYPSNAPRDLCSPGKRFSSPSVTGRSPARA